MPARLPEMSRNSTNMTTLFFRLETRLAEQNDSIPEEIYDLARKRSSFKANKMYAEADAIRQQIANKGYAVKDIKGGSFELVKL